MKPLLKTTACCLSLIITCAISQVAQAASFWNGVDVATGNTNWSLAANWANGVPIPAGGAIFSNDVSARAASPYSAVGNGSGGITTFNNFNSLVDPGFVLLNGGSVNSLTYTNGGTFQNTYISNNVTLILGNFAGTTSLSVGGGGFTNLIVTATIGGPGTLSVTNPLGTVFVGVGAYLNGISPANDGILDLSGLNYFNATCTNLFVGVGTANNRFDGILYLALTNTIRLDTPGSSSVETSEIGVGLDVGDSYADSNVGNRPSDLYLGKTNAIFTDNIEVGRQKSSGLMAFNPNFTANSITPSAWFRGNSASAVAIWGLGDGEANGGTTSNAGTNDFTAASGGSDGYVNALVSTMYVGRAANAASGGTSTGVLSFDNGIFNVTTLYCGLQPSSPSTGTKSAVGIINVGGVNPPGTIGTLVINGVLYLASNTNGTAGTAGTLNISNGVVDANSIIADANNTANPGVSTISVNGGTLALTNTIASLASPLTTLTVSNSATLTLNSISLTSTNIEVKTVITDNPGTGKIVALTPPVVTGYPTYFPIIGYSSSGGAASFASVTLPGGFIGTVYNDGTATLWVEITGGPSLASVTWQGNVNNVWNTNTLNWTNSAGQSVKYANLDLVTFDDTAHTQNVTITNILDPITWTNNNSSLNYTFSGAGAITGTVGLTMNGNASVDLAETGGDNFGGGVTINNSGTVILDDANGLVGGGVNIVNNGTLQIGNNDANGALPSGAVSVGNGGTLIYDHTSNDNLAISIFGQGGLTKNGSGTLTISVSNNYAGPTAVNGGALVLTNSGNITMSSSVSVSNATLDVSAFPSGVTLGALNVTNATLNLAVGYIQTNILINGQLSSGTPNSTINVLSLPPIAAYPANIPLIAAGGINGFNFTVGNMPAGGYTSPSITQSGNTVFLHIVSGPVGVRPYVVWSGIDSNNNGITNWTDANNWLSPTIPGAADNVIFNDMDGQGGSPLNGGLGEGVVDGALNPQNFNNVVNANFTLASLTYTNLNGGNNEWQNTLINNGVTLTVTNSGTNSINLLSIGSATADFGAGLTEDVTIGGTNGTLNVNSTNDSIFVGLATAANGGSGAVLDLSALGTFDATVNTLGVGGYNTATYILSGDMYLAATNNITLVGGVNSESSQNETVSLMVGQSGKNPAGTVSTLYLGQTNTINASYIGVAIAKESGTIIFGPAWSSPSAVFRGADGVSPVTVWSIADQLAQTGNAGHPTGIVDFTTQSGGVDGFVNALVGTMYIGRTSAGTGASAGPTTGTLAFDLGTIAVGTIYDGYEWDSTTSTGIGNINVGTGSSGATLSVGTLNMAITTAGTGATATTGALTINGGTVDAGTINTDPNATGQSTLEVENGGTLVLTNTAGTPASPITTLTLNSGTLTLNPVNGATNICGGANVSIGGSTITINIASIGNPSSGTLTIPLISYTGGDPDIGGLTLGTTPAGYTSPSLVDDTTGHINLVITGPPTLTWAGEVGATLNSNWDVGITPDWSGSDFQNNYLALFPNSAANGVVNLKAALTPGATTVNNSSLNYSFIGIGNVTGNTLTKQGSGSLLIDNSAANSFSGVNITGGTVQVGNNDVNGSLGSGPISDGGALVFDQSSISTAANAISGSGSVSQVGTGTLTLGGANTAFTGTISITNGVLNATTAAGLGAATTVTVTNTGSYDVNGVALNSVVGPAFIVSGNGYNGLGAIINNGAVQEGALSNLTLSANVTFGGTNRWDIRAPTGTNASLNESPASSPYSITKVGPNEVALVSVGTVDAGLGNIYVQSGEFAIQNGTAQLGNSASNLVVSSGAVLEMFALTTPLNKVISLSGNGSNNTLQVDSGTAANDNVVIGPITLAGTCNIFVNAPTNVCTIGSTIGGSGGIAITGPGSVTLTNANDSYSGNTIVNAGTLLLTGVAAIPNSSVSVNNNAIFNVSGLASVFTLGSSQALGGGANGVINGNVHTASGTLALSYASGSPSLAVTNGTLTLSSSTTATITNTGAQLAAGAYVVVTTNTTGFITGTAPSSVSVTGGGAVGAASLSISNGLLYLTVSAAPTGKPGFTSIGINGNTLSFTATNVQGNYTLYETTNLLPPVTWTPVFTNSGSGTINVSTNVLNPAIPNEFFLLEEP